MNPEKLFDITRLTECQRHNLFMGTNHTEKEYLTICRDQLVDKLKTKLDDRYWLDLEINALQRKARKLNEEISRQDTNPRAQA
jgi:hypothetical protein